jgi:spermidine synthase
MESLGKHIIVEFYECDQEKINNVSFIEKSMLEAAKLAGATIINSTFHHFSPFGVSGVIVIEESHLAIHTWPEYLFTSVDLFTCGELVDPWISFDYLKQRFSAHHSSSIELQRGQPHFLNRKPVKKPHVRDHASTKHKKITSNRSIWFTERDNNIALSLRHKGDVLYQKQSKYQKIEVIDTIAYGKTLILDGMIMTTEKDEYVYHEMITHVPLFCHQKPENMLIIGGGDGGTARELLKHQSIKSIDIVEIDQNVIDACKQFLPNISSSFSNPKVNTIIDDGLKFINNCPDGIYDIIIVDSTDPVGPAEGLFTEEFYKAVFRCLKTPGIMVTQSESPRFNEDVFKEIQTCYQKIFGYENVHPYLAYIPTYPSGMWSFSLCSKQNIHPIKNFRKKDAIVFTKNHKLNYYNPKIHESSFVLPEYVNKILFDNKSSKNRTLQKIERIV